MVVEPNDYRFLVAELAIEKLEQRIRVWGLPWPLNKSKTLNMIESIKKNLKRLRYSFLSAEEIAKNDNIINIKEKTKELATHILNPNPPRLELKQKFALAEIRWALSILVGLPLRFLLGDSNRPEYAIDVIGVEVTRVEPLEGAGNLFVTRASTGNIVFTVITNIKNIKINEYRAIALLPPIEFHGVISEAMYASNPIDKKYLGKRVPRKLLHSEVAAQVIRLVNKR